MVKAGIIGGSGYTGGELIRILMNHSQVVIDFVYSTTRAGSPISSAHPDLIGAIDLSFTGHVNLNIDVVFLCLGHGNSKKFLKEHQFSDATKIIDLSTDFRHQKKAMFGNNKFVYGLPEYNKRAIKEASYIANPGCFATAIQLALLPLAKKKSLQNAIHVNATTGSTGAGVQPTATTHYSWRTSNMSWYKPFTHQHLVEIKERLNGFQEDIGELFFLPHRGNFSRGILATAYTHYNGSTADANQLYQDFYKDAKFTHITEEPIHLKQVVNTNQCHIHLHKHEDTLLVTAAIDNLLKGASGQAVQNMNLMFGLNESEGKGVLHSNGATSMYMTKRDVSSIKKFESYGNVTVSTDNREAVKNADILIFAVQPGHFSKILEEIKDLLTEKHVVISTITGFSIAKIESIIGAKNYIIRSMPNTAISVGKSMTCICANTMGKDRIELAKAIFKISHVYR